jgi:hypothetical protein
MREKLLQVSCVGGFGSNSFMYKINGTANINAIRAAAEKGAVLFSIHVIIVEYSVSFLGFFLYMPLAQTYSLSAT